jgi:hypothetical protein
MWQSGYTAKTNNYGNYRAVGSLSQRFFQDNLGAICLLMLKNRPRCRYLDANYDIVESRPDSTGFRPVTVRDVTMNRHIETRQRYGGNLILDYKLPNGSIKSVNMLTRLVSDFSEYRTVLNYRDGILNFNYQEGINTTDLMVNTLNLDYDFRWIKMDLKYAKTSSRNNLPESPYLQFKSPGNAIDVGSVDENTIPESLLTVIKYPDFTTIEFDNVNLFSSLYKEDKNVLSFDFKVPYSMGKHLLGYIKFGGQYYDQSNSNDQETPYATLYGEIIILIHLCRIWRINLVWKQIHKVILSDRILSGIHIIHVLSSAMISGKSGMPVIRLYQSPWQIIYLLRNGPECQSAKEPAAGLRDPSKLWLIPIAMPRNITLVI